MPPFIIKDDNPFTTKKAAFRRWVWVRAGWCVDAVITGFAFGLAVVLATGGKIWA